MFTSTAMNLIVILAILACVTEGIGDSIISNHAVSPAENMGNGTAGQANSSQHWDHKVFNDFVAEIIVKFSRPEILSSLSISDTVSFLLFFLLIFIIHCQANAVSRISQLERENTNLKEMATMNRKFVTAANKRAKEEVEPAVSEIRRKITELSEKNKRHSDLLFEHGHGIATFEKKLSEMQQRHAEKQSNNVIDNTVHITTADATTFCDLGSDKTDMEEVLRLKINEIVAVVSDMSWRLGRVETKFFVREHDVDAVLCRLLHDVTSLYRDAQLSSHSVPMETWV